MKDYKKIDGYSLSQVTSETGIHKDNFFRMAARGDLGLWVWSNSMLTMDGEEKGWFKVPIESVEGFDEGVEGVWTYTFIMLDGKKITPAGWTQAAVIQVGLDGIDRFTTPDGEYNSDGTPHISRLEKSPVLVYRNWLKILPHDMEKLTQDKPALDTNPPKTDLDTSPAAEKIKIEDRGHKLIKMIDIVEYCNKKYSVGMSEATVNRMNKEFRLEDGSKFKFTEHGRACAWSKDLDYVMEKKRKKGSQRRKRQL